METLNARTFCHFAVSGDQGQGASCQKQTASQLVFVEAEFVLQVGRFVVAPTPPRPIVPSLLEHAAAAPVDRRFVSFRRLTAAE